MTPYAHAGTLVEVAVEVVVMVAVWVTVLVPEAVTVEVGPVTEAVVVAVLT